MGHWKKPFKSDHLSSADLEGKELVLVISHVVQEIVKTKGGDELANIAYFTDKRYKPMRLNVGNSDIVRRFAGGDSDTDNWKKMIPVTIYVDPKVRWGSDTVEGLRIKKVQPRINEQGANVVTKKKLDPQSAGWVVTIDWLKKGGAIETISEKYDISAEDLHKLKKESGLIKDESETINNEVNAESTIRPAADSAGQGTEVEN